MKHLLIGLALLASCAHPNTPPPPKAEPIGADSLTSADSLAQVPIKLRLHADDSGYTPQQVVRRRLFGLLPPKPTPNPLSLGVGVPRKCKGCQITIQNGNGNSSGQSNTEKKGQTQGAGATNVEKPKNSNTSTGSGDLTDQRDATNGAVAKGDNNGFRQTAEPPPPKLSAWEKFKAGVASVWATAKGPLIGLAVIVAIVGGIHFFAPASAAALWLAGLVRRKKPADNQA